MDDIRFPDGSVPVIIAAKIFGKDGTYDKMNATKTILCSKDRFYEMYRKFFWILDEMRE